MVVHLAFAILSASDATRELNVDGSRRVFEEAAKAGVERICYASSVAAYGFHDDNPDWLTEEIPPRGSPAAPVLAPEGRGRARAGRGAAEAPRDVGVRLPALHRGRPGGAHDAPGDPLLPPRRGDAGRGGAPARLAAGAEAGDPRPGQPLPARARGGRGERLRGRRARRRRARSLQPGRRRHPDDVGPRRRARLVLGAGAEAGGGRHRRDRHAAAARCPTRSPGSTRCASRC